MCEFCKELVNFQFNSWLSFQRLRRFMGHRLVQAHNTAEMYTGYEFVSVERTIWIIQLRMKALMVSRSSQDHQFSHVIGLRLRVPGGALRQRRPV